MAKKVTLADIAAEVGVSSVAVHKALTGKPGVSDGLREDIRAVADRLGYKTNEGGKAPEEGDFPRTGNIGVLMPELYYGLTVSFYGQLYEQVIKKLYKQEYYGILELLTEEAESSGQLPRVLQEGKVDGLILLGVTDEAYMKAVAEQSPRPVIFLDTYHPAMEFDAVISNGYHGTYMLTSYLVSQGYERIGFVGSVDATTSIADRYWGYRRALREHGIAFKDSWEIPDRDTYGETYKVILESPGELEALVCNCDFTAYRVIQNLEERGYQVPRDISLVGFDDFLPPGIKEDWVTSYKVDMERMSELCVKSLVRKINKKKYTQGVQTVAGRIVYKSSVLKKENLQKTLD